MNNYRKYIDSQDKLEELSIDCSFKKYYVFEIDEEPCPISCSECVSNFQRWLKMPCKSKRTDWNKVEEGTSIFSIKTTIENESKFLGNFVTHFNGGVVVSDENTVKVYKKAACEPEA